MDNTRFNKVNKKPGQLYANLKSLNTGDDNYNDLKLNLCTYNKILKKCIREAKNYFTTIHLKNIQTTLKVLGEL